MYIAAVECSYKFVQVGFIVMVFVVGFYNPPGQATGSRRQGTAECSHQ